MTGAQIDVEGLGFAYPGGTRVLSDVGFHVAAGERVAILGPNGAGKTTLALHLNGIHLPGAGDVRVGGVRVTRATTREIRRRVGMVFQDPDDQLFMPTVGADVAFGPANYGLEGEALRRRVESALGQVGLPDMADSAPHRLSFGQRRRAAIATILAMDIDVMVLDEPTSNVDGRSRRELVETLTGLECTMLVITHDLGLALELCPRSLLLDAGRLVVDAPTRQLLSKPAVLARHGMELPWGFALDG